MHKKTCLEKLEMRSAAAQNEPILATEDLSVNFGGLVAVNRVNFSMIEGELCCLIGPNGAGKTTFFNLVTGHLKPSGGRIKLMGKDITGLHVHDIICMGIARTFQITSLYDNLSVYETVRLAAQRKRESFNPFLRAKDLEGVEEKAIDALLAVDLKDKMDFLCGELPHGEKRKIELAIALALEGKLLLLDEPTAGLNDAETAEMAALIKRISSAASILVIEHDMAFVRDIAHRITVLNRGEIIAEGTPQEVEKDDLVKAVYLEGTAK